MDLVYTLCHLPFDHLHITCDENQARYQHLSSVIIEPYNFKFNLIFLVLLLQIYNVNKNLTL